MGLFKQMKDMKYVVQAAPGLVDQAQQMAASAQQYQAQALASQIAASGQLQPKDGGLEPIAGVDITRYATIVKGIAAYGYDQSRLPAIAAAHGIDDASWQQAHDGWNARIKDDPAVARAFNDAYRSV